MYIHNVHGMEKDCVFASIQLCTAIACMYMFSPKTLTLQRYRWKYSIYNSVVPVHNQIQHDSTYIVHVCV